MGQNYICLRNLPTHTVNNLQQKLNYVKLIQFLLLNENSILLFTFCVKISEQYILCYAIYSIFNTKGSKSKVRNNAI